MPQASSPGSSYNLNLKSFKVIRLHLKSIGHDRSPAPCRPAHIRLLRSGFSLELLEEVMGEVESSCWYNALSSFTSSSTSCA